MTIDKSLIVTVHTLSLIFIYFPFCVKKIKKFIKLTNLKTYGIISCVLLMPACTTRHFSVHFYDGLHKEKKDLATIRDVFGEGFTLDGHSVTPYLPPKELLEKEEIDEYFVLPGKRRFVFTKTIITGYKKVEICNTDTPYNYCGFDDKQCMPPIPMTTCSLVDTPIFKTEQSKEVSLHLKSGHIYDITVISAKPAKIHLDDLGSTSQ
jgi:hypothetical protein